MNVISYPMERLMLDFERRNTLHCPGREVTDIYLTCFPARRDAINNNCRYNWKRVGRYSTKLEKIRYKERENHPPLMQLIDRRLFRPRVSRPSRLTAPNTNDLPLPWRS